MLNTTTRAGRTGGKHRKQTPNKGRVALVAVATGALSTAGAGGAAAANLQAAQQSTPQESNVDYTLANDSDVIEQTDVAVEEAPQILAISEYKPTENLDEQLGKAVEYSTELAEADKAMRGPAVVKPAEGAFTSGFGPRWGTMHNGVDIANLVGTPILAVMDGTVIDSGPAQGYGQWIRIQHGDGSISVYGHMETLDVAVGDAVIAGQKIAGMGNRGFSTGSHLHFEIHPAGQGPIDPQPWLAQRGIFL
ncbi:M23 family metallopeptidase [Corynebacterium pilosum]|uniref:Protein related to metalloendopeptidase n=1 Tax=Corynebacterium pilosum TaxID=35756 RepID=A0A376CN87_9CORY|nr:M23 family metallopeptidase [Corynebacterium pilosum]STC69961.1 protein related to metalloendopeptidase [Corynebacterium pilosum]